MRTNIPPQTNQPPPATFPTAKSRRWVVAVVATVAAVSALLTCSAAVMLLLRHQNRKRRQRNANSSVDSDADEQFVEAEFEKGVGPRRYYYRELAAATSNFAEENKLGRGGAASARSTAATFPSRTVTSLSRCSPQSRPRRAGSSSRPRSGSLASYGTATSSSSSAGPTAGRASYSSTSSSRRAAWTSTSTATRGY